MSRKSVRRRFRIETLETRLCPVLGAFDIPTVVPAGGGYDGVAAVNLGTGALLSTARHILTAAHAINASNDIDFIVGGPQGPVAIDVPDLGGTQHPEYGINPDDYDIGVIELAALGPLTAERWGIYTASDEVGKVGFIAGYGMTGTGTTGNATDIKPLDFYPTDNGSGTNYELVRFTITGNPTGGLFYPRLTGSLQTVSVSYNTTAANLANQLNNLPGISQVQVRLVGDTDFNGTVDNVGHPYAGSFEALFLGTPNADHSMANVVATDNFTGGKNPGIVVQTILEGGTPRQLRSGKNQVGATDKNGSRLLADFDDGTNAGSTLNDGGGQGANEGFGSNGDSGSPIFINGKIAGVHEGRRLAGHDGITRSSDFGEQDSWVRVSFHQNFINNILDDPFPLVLDMDNQYPGNDSITVSRVGDNFQIQFNGVVVYTEWLGRIQNITIHGSAANELITVSNLDVGVPVLIQGSSGNDTITVSGKTPSTLNVDGQGGNDVVNIFSVNAGDQVTVLGSSGQDTVNVSNGNLDSAILGDLIINGSTLAVILNDTAVVGAEDYNFTDDWFDKPSMPGRVLTKDARTITLNTSVGVNAVFVQQTQSGVDYFINTGGSNDSITIGVGNVSNDIRGDVSVVAGFGTDTLIVNDNSSLAADRTYSFTSSQYTQTGLSAAVTYLFVDTVVFEQSNTSSTINVTSTDPGMTFDLRGHGGNDSFNVLTPPAALVMLDGSTGTDTTNINATGGNDSIWMALDDIGFDGAGKVQLSGMQTVNLNCKAGSDQLRYKGTAGTKDAVRVDASNVTGSGKITANGFAVQFTNTEAVEAVGNSTDADTLTFYGTNLNDRFVVNLSADGTVADPVLSFQNSGVERMKFIDYLNFAKLNLYGQDGSDVFLVSVEPKSPRGRSLHVVGGGPGPFGNDVDRLSVFVTGSDTQATHQPSPLVPGSGRFDIKYPKRVYGISYEGIESADFEKPNNFVPLV